MQARDVDGIGASWPGYRPLVSCAATRDQLHRQVAMGPCGIHDGRSAGATAINEDPVCARECVPLVTEIGLQIRRDGQPNGDGAHECAFEALVHRMTRAGSVSTWITGPPADRRSLLLAGNLRPGFPPYDSLE